MFYKLWMKENRDISYFLGVNDAYLVWDVESWHNRA